MSRKIGFFVMVVVVSVVSYYFTNLVNPIPKPSTADTPKEVPESRTVASDSKVQDLPKIKN